MKNGKAEAKVGDMVRFFDPLNKIWVHDDIVYIKGRVIEGKTYDLTYIDFEIINTPKSK